MKPKLNQFDDLRERFKAKRDARKPFQAVGAETINAGRKRAPAKPKCKTMYENGFFNPDYTDLWI